jgi:hypothetical protein
LFLGTAIINISSFRVSTVSAEATSAWLSHTWHLAPPAKQKLAQKLVDFWQPYLFIFSRLRHHVLSTGLPPRLTQRQLGLVRPPFLSPSSEPALAILSLIRRPIRARY